MGDMIDFLLTAYGVIAFIVGFAVGFGLVFAAVKAMLYFKK